MGNRHIKVINGRRYYYESIRKGKKILSRYLGPVDERIRKKKSAEDVKINESHQEQIEEENYIG